MLPATLESPTAPLAVKVLTRSLSASPEADADACSTENAADGPRRPAGAGAWLLRVLLLAATYFIAGRLGLLLAVPPGYATAIWPPSGLALIGILLFGARHWPGVLLGSFCVNAGMGFDASSQAAIVRSLAVAASIGVGA